MARLMRFWILSKIWILKLPVFGFGFDFEINLLVRIWKT